MKTLRPLLLLPLLAACATLGIGGHPHGDSERMRLWTQAFEAYSRDSLRVSQALFQRLASEYPRTHEGHEARYFLGVLSLDPRGNVDARAAEEHLGIYLADDSARALNGGFRREAGTLLRLAHEIRNPCGQRIPGLGCDTAVVSRTVTAPGEPAPPPPNAAELSRLRRQLNERDSVIRDLRAELERIRNTLAPRTPPE